MNLKNCPYCAEEIKQEAIKCKYCGEFLDQTTNIATEKSNLLEQADNELLQKINKLYSLIGDKKDKIAIADEIKSLCSSKDEAIVFLHTYHAKFGIDINNHVRKIFGNQSTIKSILAPLIYYKIVQESFPYGLKDDFIETDEEILRSKANERPKRKSKTKWLIWVVLIIALTLPFHYVPSKLMVFPKNSLTFSYTIITKKDIEDIIDRYNESSFLEQAAMSNEPIIRKLREKGIIVEIDSE